MTSIEICLPQTRNRQLSIGTIFAMNTGEIRRCFTCVCVIAFITEEKRREDEGRRATEGKNLDEGRLRGPMWQQRKSR